MDDQRCVAFLATDRSGGRSCAGGRAVELDKPHNVEAVKLRGVTRTVGKQHQTNADHTCVGTDLCVHHVAFHQRNLAVGVKRHIKSAPWSLEANLQPAHHSIRNRCVYKNTVIEANNRKRPQRTCGTLTINGDAFSTAAFEPDETAPLADAIETAVSAFFDPDTSMGETSAAPVSTSISILIAVS